MNANGCLQFRGEKPSSPHAHKGSFWQNTLLLEKCDTVNKTKHERQSYMTLWQDHRARQTGVQEK